MGGADTQLASLARQAWQAWLDILTDLASLPGLAGLPGLARWKICFLVVRNVNRKYHAGTTGLVGLAACRGRSGSPRWRRWDGRLGRFPDPFS